MTVFWIGTMTPQSEVTRLRMKDNGICVADEEGVLFALSEERVTGIKHDHRHDSVWATWANRNRQAAEKIVRVGLSSCSDSPSSYKRLPRGLVAPTVDLPSHHYSHALSAFLLSPFVTSFILVLDAGGNTFPITNTKKEWWAQPREQTSLWFGEKGSVSLVDRMHWEPYEIGFGEWYRAVTYFLGWNSHTLSGNSMALAARGDPTKLSSESFFEIARRLGIKNSPSTPVDMVSQVLKYLGRADIVPRGAGETLHAFHADLAAFLQSSLEDEVLIAIREWKKKYKMSSICLTGGVAQNCLLNTKVAQLVGAEHVYVSPFAGDVGQCVGNALFARSLDIPGAPRPKGTTTFLGNCYLSDEIENTLLSFGLKSIRVPPDERFEMLGDHLAAGKVVAVAHGREEFGARALGNRSVLGDPCQPHVVRRIIEGVKRRDDFMPLAPIVHQDYARQLSQYGFAPLSSAMVYAPKIPDVLKSELGACCHVDGTSRLQVASGGTAVDDILASFCKRTNRRALINTSFNRRGSPMVSTPKDAVQTFMDLDIDILLLGEHIVDARENGIR